MRATIVGHLRAHLVRGLLLVLPLLITVWLIGILFRVIHGNVTPLVLGVLRLAGVEEIERWPRLAAPLIGVALTFLSIYLLGLLAANLVGRRILQAVESWILRVPLVKGIYGSARQLLDAFSVTGSSAFTKVVMVEYPRLGAWTVGFLTSRESFLGPVRGGSGLAPHVNIFLPTTPNPTSGWLVIVPTEQVLELDVSVEEGIKLVVSGGIVSPKALGGRTRPLVLGEIESVGS